MTDLLGKGAFENKGGFNPGGYVNEKADELFAKGRQEFDREKRAEIYAEWAKMSNEELPMLLNATRDELWAVAAGWTGFENMNPFYKWTSCIFDVDFAQ
jgi:ABC-type transport system substrate-binding protein